MSTTADATVTITCPDWCEVGAQQHADELHEWDGRCLHHGVIADVPDAIGEGVEWSPWDAHPVVVSPTITVSVTATTNPDGRPTHTPGIKLGDDLHPIDQIQALIRHLERAVQLATEQYPHWPAAS